MRYNNRTLKGEAETQDRVTEPKSSLISAVC